GWSSVRAKGTARVAATTRPPSVATAKANAAGFLNVKTSPSGGFLLFPAPGSRMLVDGREGDSLRVRLADDLTGWVDARDVESSTSAVPPRAETGNIGVTETPSGATVRIGLSERVPFELVESDARDALTVRLFSATGHTNIVSTEGGDDFVEQVRWRQEATGVVAVTVRLKPGRRLWGFNARYDGSTNLHLDLRKPPRVDRKRPLAGIRVMLDPGHMPSAPG